MAKRLPFHIQHNTTPTAVEKTLRWAVEGELSLESLSNVLRYGKGTTEKVIVPFLRQIGILDKWQLGKFGERLRELMGKRPDLLSEAVHVHLYTLHWRKPEAYFSFAYSKICDWLWERGVWQLDRHRKAELVGVVVRAAEESYGVNERQIAFSTNSVNGALNWLKSLDPPTIVDGQFERRKSVPLPTLLWSIDSLYHHPKWRRDYGVRMALDEERLNQLCKLCLLDLDGLEEVFKFAIRTTSHLRIGTEGGFGRWLSLIKAQPIGIL